MEELIGHGFTKYFSSTALGSDSKLQLPPKPANITPGPDLDVENLAVVSSHNSPVTVAIIIMFFAAFTFGVALVCYLGGDVF